MLIRELDRRAATLRKLANVQPLPAPKPATPGMVSKIVNGIGAVGSGVQKAVTSRPVRAVGRGLKNAVLHPLQTVDKAGKALGIAGGVMHGAGVYKSFNPNNLAAQTGVPLHEVTASVKTMNLDDLMKLSAQVEPEMMQKVAENIAALEKVDRALLPELVADFRHIANRVDEKSKTAGIGTAMKDIGIGAGKALAGSLLVGLGTAAATDFFRASKSKLTEGRNFKRMMEANQDLRAKPVGDLRRSFKSLQRFAPDVAADPLAAGSIVFRLANGVAGDHDRILRDAVGLQKDQARQTFMPQAKVPFDLPKRDMERPLSAGEILKDIEAEKSLHETTGRTSNQFRR